MDLGGGVGRGVELGGGGGCSWEAVGGVGRGGGWSGERGWS